MTSSSASSPPSHVSFNAGFTSPSKAKYVGGPAPNHAPASACSGRFDPADTRDKLTPRVTPNGVQSMRGMRAGDKEPPPHRVTWRGIRAIQWLSTSPVPSAPQRRPRCRCRSTIHFPPMAGGAIDHLSLPVIDSVENPVSPHSDAELPTTCGELAGPLRPRLARQPIEFSLNLATDSGSEGFERSPRRPLPDDGIQPVPPSWPCYHLYVDTRLWIYVLAHQQVPRRDNQEANSWLRA